MSAGHWCVGIQRAGPDPAGVVPVCTILAHAQVEKSSFVDPRQAFYLRATTAHRSFGDGRTGCPPLGTNHAAGSRGQ